MMRQKRRSSWEILHEAVPRNGVSSIESAYKVVGLDAFNLSEETKDNLLEVSHKLRIALPELTFGDHLLFDRTEKNSQKVCYYKRCGKRALSYETRMMYVYDVRDFEYSVSEFGPEISSILLGTRREATICQEDFMSLPETEKQEVFRQMRKKTLLRQVGGVQSIENFRRGGVVLEFKRPEK